MTSPIGAGLLIVRRRDGKVLLIQRAAGGSKPGYWNPPGGSVEGNETPFEAAVREAREELGPLPALEWRRDEGYWHANGPYFAFGTFLGILREEYDSWTPRLNEESSAWAWCSADDLPSPLVPGVRGAIRDLAERVWRWKPPSLGIAAQKSYTICKAINLNQDSPYYLSAALTIYDESSRRAAALTLPFEDRRLFSVIPPICRSNVDPERVVTHYQSLVDQDPDVVLSCMEGVLSGHISELALQEMKGKLPEDVYEHVRRAVDELVLECLGQLPKG